MAWVLVAFSKFVEDSAPTDDALGTGELEPLSCTAGDVAEAVSLSIELDEVEVAWTAFLSNCHHRLRVEDRQNVMTKSSLE